MDSLLDFGQIIPYKRFDYIDPPTRDMIKVNDALGWSENHNSKYKAFSETYGRQKGKEIIKRRKKNKNRKTHR